MATGVMNGAPIKKSVTMDKDGYRDYKATFLVKGDPTDGPFNALNAAGLPAIGAYWNFDADADLWATRRMETSVTERTPKEGHPVRFWEVELTYSNKGDTKYCKDQQIDDPLLQPQKVSGSFVKYQTLGLFDRHGRRIMSSSHEPLVGPNNEWDDGRPQIVIEQNVPVLQLYMLTQMVDTVNHFEIWGLPPRTVKLSDIKWERKFYGTCFVYYTRTFTFDVRFKRVAGVLSDTVVLTGTQTAPPVYTDEYETFDRDLVDEGYKVINGHWQKGSATWVLDKIDGLDPDFTNPAHFIQYHDRKGNVGKVILDGVGSPANALTQFTGTGTGTLGVGTQGRIHVEKYGESDFTLLQVPILLEV